MFHDGGQALTCTSERWHRVRGGKSVPSLPLKARSVRLRLGSVGPQYLIAEGLSHVWRLWLPCPDLEVASGAAQDQLPPSRHVEG